MKVLSCILFILVASLSVSWGWPVPNGCVPLNQPDVPSLCRDVLPNKVGFVPTFFNASRAEVVFNASFAISAIDNPLVPPDCRANLVRLICLTAFQDCYSYNAVFVPIVLEGLRDQISAGLTKQFKAGAVQFGIGLLWGGGNQDNYFNANTTSLFTGYTLPYWASVLSRPPVPINPYTPVAQTAFLYNDCNSTTLPLPGIMCDSVGASLINFWDRVRLATNDTSQHQLWVDAYNVTDFQDILNFANYLIQVAEDASTNPVAFPQGLPATVFNAFLGQWTNYSLIPTGLDLNNDSFPDGFEIGHNGAPVASGISLASATLMWNKQDNSSFLEPTNGIYLWLDAISNSSTSAASTLQIKTNFLLSDNNFDDLKNWMNFVVNNLTINLLQLQLGPDFAQLLYQAYFSTPPCRSLCRTVHDTCADFAKTNPDLPLPDCAEPNQFVPTLPNYPDGSLIIPLPGINVTMPCRDGSQLAAVAATTTPIDCSPLVYKEGAYPPCVIPCLLPILSESQTDRMMLTFHILGLFSCILSGVSMVMLCIRKSFKFPKNLQLFMNICSFAVACVIVFNWAYGWKKVVCKDIYTPALQNDMPCGMEGAWIYFFSFSGTLWWMLIAINLFLTIVLDFGKQHRRKMEIAFYLIGTVIPLILMIIGLGNKKFGYLPGFPWCFILGDNENWWELGLWYIPNLVMIFIGTVCVLIVVVKVVQSTLASKGYLSSGKKAKIPHETYRMVFFTFMFIYVFIFIQAYRIDSLINEDSIQASFEEYVLCRYKAQFDPYKVLRVEDCKQTNPINYSLLVWNIVNASVQGVLIFVFFFLSRDTFKFCIAKIRGLETPNSNTSNSRSERKGTHATQELEMGAKE